MIILYLAYREIVRFEEPSTALYLAGAELLIEAFLVALVIGYARAAA